MTQEERFWKKFRCVGDCLEWTGYRNKVGYGHYRFNGEMKLIHRVVWELNNGPISEGLFVLHHCDNPPCGEIDHLFLGTTQDNIKDCCDKNRRNQVGENNNCSKLTNEEVDIIRGIYNDGGVTMKQLAKDFGVSDSAIFNYVHQQTYR